MHACVYSIILYIMMMIHNDIIIQYYAVNELYPMEAATVTYHLIRMSCHMKMMLLCNGYPIPLTSGLM